MPLKPLVKLPYRIAAAPSLPDGDVEEIVQILSSETVMPRAFLQGAPPLRAC
jgi:hypothetical protein